MFFPGHSNAPQSIFRALEDAVERHIVEYARAKQKRGEMTVTNLAPSIMG